MNCENIDKYDYLIAMATLDAKNDDVEMFENLDTSDVVLSDRIVRKIHRLIKTSRGDSSRHITKVRGILSRVAIVALVVISVMFTVMMSVSAIRNAVWNVIVEWYDKYLSIDYESNSPASLPMTIEEVRKPTLLPQGAEEAVIFDDKWSYFTEYYIENECCLVFQQSRLNTGETYVDSETAIIKEVMIGEFDGLILTYEKNTDMIILWNDGEYRYTLTGYGLDAEILVMIAKSVK